MANHRILSDTEVRKRAGGISETTLWRWRKAGLFPRARKIGPRLNGTPEAEIDAWVKNPEAWKNSHGAV